MQTKMKNLHCELRKIQNQRAHLKQIVEVAVDKHGIIIDEEIHNDLKQIIKTENSELFNNFQNYSGNNKIVQHEGMKWHPLMNKWCIYHRHQSQGAYETFCHSKCIPLPSHHIKPTPGFSADVFSADVAVQLYSAAKLHQCEAVIE